MERAELERAQLERAQLERAQLERDSGSGSHHSGIICPSLRLPW